VWGADGEVELRGQQPRALLTRLLLSANAVVASDALIEDVWGEKPRDAAANTLQANVERLRKALAVGQEDSTAELIITREPGYLIKLRPKHLDLNRFETLLGEDSDALASGDANSASEHLRLALGLWRGEPLAEFGYEQFAAAAIARLTELRLVALERRIEADLAGGASDALAAELEGFVSEHPLRERLRAHLMLALYQAGRQMPSAPARMRAAPWPRGWASTRVLRFSISNSRFSSRTMS